MAVIAYVIGEHRVLIDEEFLPLMQEYRWHPDKHNYIVAGIRGGVKSLGWIKLHRVIMGAKDGEHVDHKNGDVLDNRLANLRICSASENMRNSRPRKTSISKFKGVSPCKRSGGKLWVSQIAYDKKHKYLGRFPSEEMAAKAYDEAAKVYFGEFAWLNFPEKIEEEIIISATHHHVDFKAMTTSKYRGVYYDKRGYKLSWVARVCINSKKNVSAGYHLTQEDAARAHDKKSWEIFENLSKLNFPEEYSNDDGL